MFILEIYRVENLSQARFAAGEGFTHVTFPERFYQDKRMEFEAISAFLSGVKIGLEFLDADSTSTLPDGFNYFAQTKDNHSRVIKEINNTGVKIPIWNGNSITPAEFQDGISIVAPTEIKTGLLHVEEPLRDLLEVLEDLNLKSF